MSVKKSLKKHLGKPFYRLIFGVFLALFSTFSLSITPSFSQTVYAEPATPETTENTEDTGNTENAEETDTTETETPAGSEGDTCYDQVGAIGWLVCPTAGVLGKAIDAVYTQLEKLLVVNPIVSDESSPIYQVWQIMRDITNIVFVIFLLIIVYSQITGLGVSNYGIKSALPKLVIAAILVNLSYLICAISVDLSNIIGSNLKEIFTSIEESATIAGGLGDAAKITWTDLTAALIGGGTVAGLAIGAAGGLGAFLWPLMMALIGGIVSVLVGLITVGMRQALIAVLIMVAPLAFVAYLLPNTESWFKKWKDIFVSMLIFYPMFSLLFGAAQLAGWAIIANSLSANNSFGVVIGMAVQVMPLLLTVSLLKMSNTILGNISNKLNDIAHKPLAPLQNYSAARAELARNKHIANSSLPSAGLRRYLDGRHRQLELDNENAMKVRKGLAEVYAQRRIAGGVYEPADGAKQDKLRANSSTRLAKGAMNASLAAEYSTKDTAHLLDQYGSFYNSTKVDKALDKTAGGNYLELYRSMLAEENDAFADQDWVMGQYDKFRREYEPSNRSNSVKAKQSAYNYKHYIVGAAGAFGESGSTMVLGQTIAKSAKHEAMRKSYVNYAFSKYGYNKRDARNMAIGYYNNDDGFASNPDGSDYYYEWDDSEGNHHRVKERSPGEFLKYHPEWLKPIAYDKYDLTEDGKKRFYYEARDQKGQFIGKVYKDDTPAMKEILSNWDMPINDPINGLYGILTGVYEGDYSKYGLDGVGLAGLSTTLQRATLAAKFKEKASFAGPMYANSIGQRYIKDFIHLNIARLDNLIKVAKPSGFNTQDAAELQQLKLLMNPENWDWMLFDTDSLRSFKNVNGKPLKVIRNEIDPATGETHEVRVAPEDATPEELRDAVIKKFLLPAAPKFATMMSRITNGIIDNQKPGAAENWSGLVDALEMWNDPKWKKKYPLLNDPFAKQATDTIFRARQISRRIRPTEGNRPSPALRERMYKSQQRANRGMDDPNEPYQLTEEDKRVDREFAEEERRAPWSIYNQPDYEDDPNDPSSGRAFEDSLDHFVRLDMIAAENATSVNFFFDGVREYFDEQLEKDSRFHQIIDDFEEYARENETDDSITIEDHLQAIKDLVVSIIHD